MWKLLARCAPGALPSIVMWIIARVSTAALAVAFVLVGCVPTTTPASPAPRPSATPVFATEAEALAAATEAYAAYVRVSDEITADGGENPERIAPHVTAAQLKRDRDVFATYRAKKIVSVGSTSFDRLRLQKFDERGRSGLDLVVYICLDLTKIRLIDIQMQDITPTGLDQPSPMQVTLRPDADQGNLLVVERSESWSGENFCSS